MSFKKRFFGQRNVTGTMILEQYFKLNVTFNILKCPEGKELTNPIPYVFVCIEVKQFDNSMILAIAIPVSIICGILIALLISVTGIILFRCVINIHRKISLLERKVRAEELMEKKINDKRNIFNDSTSSNLTTPLMPKNSLPLSKKKSKLIIPLEEIDIIGKIGEGMFFKTLFTKY